MNQLIYLIQAMETQSHLVKHMKHLLGLQLWHLFKSAELNEVVR